MNNFLVISAGFMLLFSLLENSCSAVVHSARTRSQQEQYLRRYGYLPSTDSAGLGSVQSVPSNTFASALRRFQRMAGIPVTGTMTTDTMRMMEMPRCGVPDHYETRNKRYALEGSKWPNKHLSYKCLNYTSDMQCYKVASEISKAFKFWSDVSGLSFERNYFMAANIDISFVSGRHADSSPFDGLGGTLAHAFFPQYGGAIHFDEDELWTSDSSSGTNLLQVAIHEIGHSLGLHHSEISDSIMAPFYRGYKRNVALHSDDITAIRQLYGAN